MTCISWTQPTFVYFGSHKQTTDGKTFKVLSPVASSEGKSEVPADAIKIYIPNFGARCR